MEEGKRRIGRLLEEGARFEFDNFAKSYDYEGDAEQYSAEWIAWQTRLCEAIRSNFGEQSAPVRILLEALDLRLLGYGRSRFDTAHSLYMGALKSSYDVLEEDTFGELLRQEKALAIKDLSNRVFIVHGHDDRAKDELSHMLTEMGLEPVVLHRQADGGKTVIEKFEEHADVGFAFILLTPDEFAYLTADKEKADSDRKVEARARPNVIFEFGYFVGRLGRQRTCCLHRGDVVIPSDLNGLVYKRFDKSVEEVGWGITRELKAAGYTLK